MQYILTEQEYDTLNQFKQKYENLQNNLDSLREEARAFGYKNGLVQFSLDALEKLITNNGSLKLINKNWVWSPVDGKHYFYTSNILNDFREQLEHDLENLNK